MRWVQRLFLKLLAVRIGFQLIKLFSRRNVLMRARWELAPAVQGPQLRRSMMERDLRLEALLESVHR
jgi:hypothetical protein